MVSRIFLIILFLSIDLYTGYLFLELVDTLADKSRIYAAFIGYSMFVFMTGFYMFGYIKYFIDWKKNKKIEDVDRVEL